MDDIAEQIQDMWDWVPTTVDNSEFFKVLSSIWRVVFRISRDIFLPDCIIHTTALKKKKTTSF